MTRTELHTVTPSNDPTPAPAVTFSVASRTRRRLLGAISSGLATAWWEALWPSIRAAVASPGWAQLTIALSGAARRARVQICAWALLALGVTVCALAGPARTDNPVIAAALDVVWALGLILLLPGGAVAAVPFARALYQHTVRGRVRTRYGLDGWASWWELHRSLSAAAVRRSAVETRPSLAPRVTRELPDGTLSKPVPALVARLPVGECGTWLGRSTVGPVRGTDCYAGKKDVVGLVAPPQTGKTALLGHHVLDHCGPAVVTSTKTELFDLCAGGRARRGPVYLFNPENLGGLGSTVWWNPIRGCADPMTAQLRAGHLVGATAGSSDKGDDRWDEWATAVLRSLLIAADVYGRDMTTVAHWIFNPLAKPDQGGAGEALDLLRRAPAGRVPWGSAESLRHILSNEARKTVDSIFLTLSRAVQFMTDPDIAALVTPSTDRPEFDAHHFLVAPVQGEDAVWPTIFLVGSEREGASIGPLLAAFTGYVFESAKRAAAGQARRRLDPPLGMFLDEAALISPVPLDRWAPDAGGRGIHIEWTVQSWSQLAGRWGNDGADTIWNSTNAKVLYGGTTLDDDLDAISALCGRRHERITQPDGTERYERVPVCPPDRLRVLPQWHALLIYRETPATIVRITPVWKRRDRLPPPGTAAPHPVSTDRPAPPPVRPEIPQAAA
ncbi:MAG: TraM recognition domain-containing protein [Pseudonocardia sp.]|nr:TraM recognition domain-containing protein [Pseudonocardia sp.]